LQTLATITLAVLAALGCHLAAEQARAADASSLIVSGLVALGAYLIRPTLSRLNQRGAGWVTDIVLIAPMVLAFLPVPVLSGVLGGAGLEYRLLVGLRNVALVGAVLGDHPRAARTAIGAALAVMLFAFSLGRGWALFAVSALFAGGCVAWLALGYWRAFAAQIPATLQRRPPTRWIVGLGATGCVSFLLGMLLYPAGSRGWLEQMVGSDHAENRTADAAGAARQDANRQTVADLTTTKYGTPADPTQVQPGTQPDANQGGSPTAALQNSSADPARQAALPLARAAHSGEVQADRTLFQLQERGPRHVPLVTYDQFDGTTWRGDQPPGARPQVAAEVGPDKGWLETIEPLTFDLASDEAGASTGDAVEDARRALDRLTRSARGGGRLVSPQLRDVNRGHLLRSLTQSASERIAPEYLLTPYDEEQLRTLLKEESERDPLAGARFTSSREYRERIMRRVLANRASSDTGLPPELRALVDEWTAGRPRGWEQIDALVQGLRAHAVHDPAEHVPPDQRDALRQFLLESRRGPDYMFATAAAILLRHLDYPTRLVGGFYARPDGYSRLTGTTTVRSDDIHYWTQVQTPDAVWVNLEPTPGYEPAAPVYTPGERAARTASVARRVIAHYWSPVLSTVAVILAWWLIRRRFAERVATVWWLIRARRPSAALVAATWRLLDRRASVAGGARRPGTTLPAFAHRVNAGAPDTGEPLTVLAEVADRLVHAPVTGSDRLGRPDPEVRAACRRAVRDWTVAAFRRALSPPSLSAKAARP
jgi:transglutaminase-like putative cysteine protease